MEKGGRVGGRGGAGYRWGQQTYGQAMSTCLELTSSPVCDQPHLEEDGRLEEVVAGESCKEKGGGGGGWEGRLSGRVPLMVRNEANSAWVGWAEVGHRHVD